MKRMSSEKKYPLYDERMVASKSEQFVGNLLIHYGYNFLYDQEYKFNESRLRYDFMILNTKDTKDKIISKHHLYIEVKDNNKDYVDSLNEKRKLVNDNENVLIILTDKDQKIFKDLIEEGLAVMRLKAEVNKLRFDNNKLKNENAKLRQHK